MSSTVSTRLCPICQTGFLMPYDLDAACEGCLSQVHTMLALVPQASCPSCKRLPIAEKKRWLAIFSPLEDDVFLMAEHFPLKEALNIFDARPDLDESASNTETLASALC